MAVILKRCNYGVGIIKRTDGIVVSKESWGKKSEKRKDNWVEKWGSFIDTSISIRIMHNERIIEGSSHELNESNNENRKKGITKSHDYLIG